jgi:hypothetical protein
MLRHSIVRTLAAAACLVLAAASTARAQKLPEWDDEGLVVGQIAGLSLFGLSTWSNGTMAGVTVGNRRLGAGSLYSGCALFTRREGEHDLKSVYGVRSNGVLELPVGRKLAVSKGRITVFGLLYFFPNPQDRKAFRVVAFDNRDETIDFLRRTYPGVLAGHDSAAVVLAPGDYLPMERLVQLRTGIARSEALRTKRQGQFWVAGRAGTLAEVKVAGDSVEVLRHIPPVTYQEPLMTTYDEQGVLTFATPTQRWRVVNGAVEVVTEKK